LLLTCLLISVSVAFSTTAEARSGHGNGSGHSNGGGHSNECHHGGGNGGHPAPTPTDPDAPADTNGKFVTIPVPPDPRIVDYVDACGVTLAIKGGDVFKLKERITYTRYGYLDEIKGGYTTDISTSDGRTINELDNSGPYQYKIFNDGTDVLTARGPSFIYAFPEEEAAFDAAGLPHAFYFTQGEFVIAHDAEGNGTYVKGPRHYTDVCTLMDRLAV
jgi:hypothetical protein